MEDLNAGGFGSLTSQALAEQNVQGSGAWNDGKWQVIFSRSLESADKDDVSFASGKTYPVAFAVWDGANQERNGQKSTSQWLNVQLRSAPKKAPEAAPESAAPAGLLTPTNVLYLLVGVTIVVVCHRRRHLLEAARVNLENEMAPETDSRN